MKAEVKAEQVIEEKRIDADCPGTSRTQIFTSTAR